MVDEILSANVDSVAKMTSRGFQTKASSKMKGFKGDEKAWPDWQYKFRVEAARSFRQAAAILDWADDMYDQPISESDIQRVTAKENWVDMEISTCDLVSLMKSALKGLKLCTSTILVTHLRNIQMLAKLLAPTQFGYQDVVASMERLEQELRVVRQRFGDDVQNVWKSSAVTASGVEHTAM